ncbi:MAG: PqqD family peptide modification chaperone [Mariprofundaceae bacterium]
MGKHQLKTETTKKRCQQVLLAIDCIAARDQLAFLTTQQVSRESDISDGVLFRHFSSKEAMLANWVETRGDKLRLLLEAMPAGRDGLIYLLQHLLQDKSLLNFLCCQPMDTPYLRQQLEICRSQFQRVIQTRIELLSSTPIGIASDVLNDHLMRSIYRAWNPENPDRNRQKERLMNQLPWEKNESGNNIFPSMDVMQRLALNDSGFVFDPVNGRSFTANEVGMYIMHFLQHSNDAEALLVAIVRDFEVSKANAQRDITDFSGQLRKFLT